MLEELLAVFEADQGVIDREEARRVLSKALSLERAAVDPADVEALVMGEDDTGVVPAELRAKYPMLDSALEYLVNHDIQPGMPNWSKA